MQAKSADFLVIGSGLAGMSVALELSELGSVVLLSKGSLSSGNTQWAQGGIAAVVSGDDTFESHIQDTILAGAGLCKEEIVEKVIGFGPEAIAMLKNWGVRFDAEGGGYSLHREGGHSARRILHAADQTGAEIHRALSERLIKQPGIKVIENAVVLDLLNGFHFREVLGPRCYGALALVDQNFLTISAKATVLATGGSGKVFLYTSNWHGATGDGIALAYRAGCRVGNLEFTQFHPTVLYHPHARTQLITEALRGEGCAIVDNLDRPIEIPHHLGALAPRDIVARAIDSHMKRTGNDCVYLDTPKLSSGLIKKKFPGVWGVCESFKISPEVQKIPVVPAAHYQCGGILVSAHAETDLPGLYAIGEVALTGLHGANRLASNSLLECLAFARFCRLKIQEQSLSQTLAMRPLQKDLFIPASPPDELAVVRHLWQEIRTLMWNYVGIVRTDKRLMRAQSRLALLRDEFFHFFHPLTPHPDVAELRNMIEVASLSVSCALARKESRGCHFSQDYPQESVARGQDTLLRPRPDLSL